MALATTAVNWGTPAYPSLDGTTAYVPWAAWFGDVMFPMPLPAGWDVQLYPPAHGPDIGEDGIAQAFANPIGTPRLAELARGRKTAAVVIDDLSRPTEGARLLPHVLRELREGGIALDDIMVILGVANHRQMMRDDIVKKVGEATLAQVQVKNHFSWAACESIGTTSRGTPVALNRDFVAADVKVLVGSICPHPTAGFGGGAKLVVPGVASFETARHWHGPNGPKTGLGLDASEARLDAEEAARMAGVSCIVNSVPNSRRQIAGLVVGDLLRAHRAGVQMARRIFATRVPSGVDIAIFTAYPKDNEFVQLGLSMNVWASAPAGRPIAREEGSVVQCSAASEGVGFHSLMGPGMALFRPDSPARPLAPRDLVIFSPGVTRHNLPPAARADPRVALHTRWEEVVESLQTKHGARSRVAVFPCSAIQLASN
jgi:hypothetical protein